MAASSTALLILLSMATAFGEECSTHTQGTCTFMACNANRGNTVCVDDPDGGSTLGFANKVCQCAPGSCSYDDQSCEAPRAAHHDSDLGDLVQVRNKESDEWVSGKITAVNPLQVQPTCWTKSFEFKLSRPQPPEYSKGQVVEVKIGAEWVDGTVEDNAPLLVKPENFDKAFHFDDVRAKDWQARAANEKSSAMTAMEQFNQAAKDAAAAAEAAHQAAKDAEERAAALARAQTAAQDKLQKAKAEADKDQKSSDEKDAEATRLEGLAKTAMDMKNASAIGAVKAKQASDDAATKAQHLTDLSNEKNAELKKKQEDSAAANAELQKDREAKETTYKSYLAYKKSGNTGMADATYKAYEFASSAVESQEKVANRAGDDENAAALAADNALKRKTEQLAVAKGELDNYNSAVQTYIALLTGSQKATANAHDAREAARAAESAAKKAWSDVRADKAAVPAAFTAAAKAQEAARNAAVRYDHAKESAAIAAEEAKEEAACADAKYGNLTSVVFLAAAPQRSSSWSLTALALVGLAAAVLVGAFKAPIMKRMRTIEEPAQPKGADSKNVREYLLLEEIEDFL